MYEAADHPNWRLHADVRKTVSTW
jgi:hypothetical protein